MNKFNIQEEPVENHAEAINRTLGKLYSAEKHHLIYTVFNLAETIVNLVVADETSEGMKAVLSMQLIEQAFDGSADLPKTIPFANIGGRAAQ